MSFPDGWPLNPASSRYSMAENIEMTSFRLKTTIAGLWTGNLFASFLVSGVAAMLPAMGLSLAASAAALSLVMVCYNLGQSHVPTGHDRVP